MRNVRPSARGFLSARLSYSTADIKDSKFGLELHGDNRRDFPFGFSTMLEKNIDEKVGR